MKQDYTVENPYRVNEHHHFDSDMSSDIVERIDSRGRIIWDCYLFSAGAVTPMRRVEFDSAENAESWANDKGSEINTFFSLDHEEINADMHILSRNHGTGIVIAREWTPELIDKIVSAYSLGTIEQVITMLITNQSVNCPNATFTLVHKDSVRHCVKCENAFVMSDNMPDRIYCSEACWQYEKSMSIQRDSEGNIYAGRMRHAVDKLMREKKHRTVMEITKEREDNKRICLQFCKDKKTEIELMEDSFCPHHFEIDCRLAREINETYHAAIEANTPQAIERREMSVVIDCLVYQDDSCRIYAYRNPEQESAIVNYESDNSIQYVPAYNERHAAYLIVRW